MNPDRKRRLSEYEAQQQQHQHHAYSGSSSSSSHSHSQPQQQQYKVAKTAAEDDDDSNGAGSDGPSRSELDLELFQKVKLAHEMDQARRNAAEVEQQLVASRTRAGQLEQKVLAVQGFWAMMADESLRIASTLEQKAGTQQQQEQSSLAGVWESFIDPVHVDDAIRRLSEQTRSSWERMRTAAASLEPHGADGHSFNALADVEARYLRAMQDNVRLKSEAVHAREQASQASTLAASKFEELDRLQRKVLRMSSAIIQRLTLPPVSSSSSAAAAASESEAAPESAATSPSKPAAVAAAAPVNGSGENDAYWLHQLDLRTREVEQLRHEKEALARQLVHSQIDSYAPDGSNSGPLEQRPIFVDLRERNKQLLSDLAEVRAKYERQEDTVNKLLQQRQQDHEQMEAQEARRKTIIEGELRTALSDGARLRTDRDNCKLQCEQAVGKAKVAEAALQETRATIQKLSDANQALSQIVSKRGEGQQGDESLFAEIEAIGKALEQSQKEGQRLSKLVAEREDEKAKLLHDREKFKQVQVKHTNEKEQLTKKLDDLRKVAEAQAEAVAKLEAREKTLVQQLAAYDSQLAGRLKLLEEEKRRANEAELLLADTKNRLSKYETNVAKIQEIAGAQQRDLERETSSNKRVQEELEKLKKQYERAEKSLSQLQSIQSGDKDAARMRTLLNCSACHKDIKEMIIVRCGHAFCRPCIDKRIETRQRKCPVCAEQFGANDVKPLFL